MRGRLIAAFYSKECLCFCSSIFIEFRIFVVGERKEERIERREERYLRLDDFSSWVIPGQVTVRPDILSDSHTVEDERLSRLNRLIFSCRKNFQSRRIWPCISMRCVACCMKEQGIEQKESERVRFDLPEISEVYIDRWNTDILIKRQAKNVRKNRKERSLKITLRRSKNKKSKKRLVKHT